MCNTASLWALRDLPRNRELRRLILKLVLGCNCPFSSRSLCTTKLRGKNPQHGSQDFSTAGSPTLDPDPSRALKCELWCPRGLSSIFTNLGFSHLGLVSCLFFFFFFHKAQVKQHVRHWRGHGNTGMPLVRGNMRYTCYNARSNRKVHGWVKRVTGFLLLRHQLTFSPVSTAFASCFRSHMDPVQSQAEYVQVSVHLCASCHLLLCLCQMWMCGTTGLKRPFTTKSPASLPVNHLTSYLHCSL